MEAHLYNNFFPVLQGNTIHEKTSEYSNTVLFHSFNRTSVFLIEI